MDLSNNTVLVTGGATGIGWCIARRLLEAGNKVLVCGRRQERLDAALERLPGLQARRCDVGTAEGREALGEWARDEGVNVLVNNAGMQRMVDLTKGVRALEAGDNEVRINFEGPVYLTVRLLPDLIARGTGAVVNVTSGLGFVPMAAMPVYCATKAGLHLFSVSLRRQLRGTGVKVFELIPPMVDTELDRGARAERGQAERGIPPEEVAQAFMEGLERDRFEIAVAGAAHLVAASRASFDEIFEAMNARS